MQGELIKKRCNFSEELAQLEATEELDGLDSEQMTRKVWLLKENLQLLDQEESYWVNRCHETGLLKGDNNTSYFHKIANGRRRKNTVISLEDGDEIIEGDENLLRHATEYYTNLFGPEEDHRIHIDQSLWNEIEQVSDLDNENLCRHFTEQEIKDALFQMKKKQGCWP